MPQAAGAQPVGKAKGRAVCAATTVLPPRFKCAHKTGSTQRGGSPGPRCPPAPWRGETRADGLPREDRDWRQGHLSPSPSSVLLKSRRLILSPEPLQVSSILSFSSPVPPFLLRPFLLLDPLPPPLSPCVLLVARVLAPHTTHTLLCTLHIPALHTKHTHIAHMHGTHTLYAPTLYTQHTLYTHITRTVHTYIIHTQHTHITPHTQHITHTHDTHYTQYTYILHMLHTL